MHKYILIIMLTVMFQVVFPSDKAVAAQILGPDIKILNNEIIVSTGLFSLDELETTINTGIEKEIIFTLELLKVWSFWPDEFVVSKKVQRAVKYDKLREQYFASTNDGNSKEQRKFKDIKKMEAWVFTVLDVNIVNIKELEPGDYYMRIIIESKSRELPPAIGLLLLLIPEVEMSLAKESDIFNIGTYR